MRIALAATVLLLGALPALAQPGAPSNLGMDRYPAPKCETPPAVDPSLRPDAPDSANRTQNATDVMLYNSRVRAYNAAMRAHNDGVKAYAACVEGYVAAARADIARIQAAVDAAVAAANGP